jgi:curved DNA-binding protein CbpA
MNTEPFVDFYALLGLPSSSTPEEIKDAFRSKMRRLHPDVNKSPEATQITQQLIVAYKILSDGEARERYDRQHSTVHSRKMAEDNSRSSMDEPTACDDPVLARWIASAREAAQTEWKNFPKDFFDAAKDIGKQSSASLWVIIAWILGFLVAFVIGSSRR